jgi:hypothetical protein
MIRFLVIVFLLMFAYGITTAHVGAGLVALFLAVFVAKYGNSTPPQ